MAVQDGIVRGGWRARVWLLLCCFGFVHAASGTITTNEALWRQLETWRAQVAAGAAAQVMGEIDALAAGGAPWRATVLSGGKWEYSWGFLALDTYAWACMRMHEPVRAYRALANAQAYLPVQPPPAAAAYHYWRWHVSMGELCALFGRHQDALWYLHRVRANVATNAGLYFKATAVLAGAMARHDDPGAACVLFEELLASRPWQPTKVWHQYIQLLFACGRFEDGVAAIVRGAHANGFSARHVERDYFIVDACRYWHFFRELDIIEWYDFLGEKLERIRVTPANQDLLTLLINTRTLLQHAYPELFGLPADDLRALKERLARAAAGTARPAVRPAANALPALAPTASPWAALVQSISAAAPACSNMALEDAVHRIMFDARKVSTWTYGAPEPWHQLLRDYPVNALTSVVVDGVPVQWLAWTTLAAIYSDRRDDVAATNWQCVALDNMTGVNNPLRLADLCLWVSRVHLRRSMRNLARVKDFAQLAVELAPSNTRVRIDALDTQAGAALLAGTPRERIAILRDLVARGGCTPRQAVYERLARDYFRTGEPRAAVAVLFTGLRRCVIKLEGGRFNHFIEALRCARSVLTAGELEQLHALLRGSALRYPATLADVASSSKALAVAQAPWLEEHLRLARIEEAGVVSDADWLFISNSVARRPSARAGRLWIKAQVAHVTTATNSIDWSGWIAGWNAVPSECEGPAGLGDTGVRNLLYADLLGVLERYEEHVDRNGTAPNGINCALQHLFGVPHAGALYARAYHIVAQWDAYLQFDFLMHRVYSKATLAADDADLARLRRLHPNMREGWGGIWRDHLLRRANEDSAGSNQWLELVKMLPAVPPAPPRP